MKAEDKPNPNYVDAPYECHILDKDGYRIETKAPKMSDGDYASNTGEVIRIVDGKVVKITKSKFKII